MKYAIKRNNNIIAQVEPQGNVSTKIMGEELVNMTFELPTMVKFQIGDSVNVYGANYYLLQAPVVEKVNTRHFKYSLQFGSVIYELSKIQLLFPDADNNLTVSEGNPIGNADLLIGHVLNNVNRLQNGWTKGTVIETEAKQVDFSEDNCLSALAKIAEAFEVEYWIDADKSIHIVERKSDSGYSFQYGKNKGLKSITRNPMDGSNIVTRLYALGSEKNIGAKYRNGSKRLKMDVPYLEKNTDIYNVIEHTKKFDEVYPKRIGTVTAVDANNPLIFTDSTMDFDLNERDGNGTTILIQGVPAKVTFQTGQLAGYMLEIKENGYHTATKTFTLNKNKDEKAIEVPSNLMRPKVGDQYIITDIVMPASYVTNAEAELKVKAQEYLDKNCKERLQYTVVSDPFFFRELNVNIALGKTVHFIDADLGLDANLRILSISKDLQNPYKVAFEIGEDTTIISIVRAYIEKEKQQTAIIKEQKYNAAAARAAYYFGLELSEKTFDSEGYFDVTKIKPASIDTKLISLGGRMQQFSLPDVNFYLENNYTSLRNTSGRIVHLTIGDTPRTWYIASNTILNIGAVYQYVYVKCQRNGTNANILVTPNQIMVDSDPDFFHFEAGYISSIQNGFRVCKMTYGFAQINPQEISIGRWTSPLGGDYIAFNESGIEIKGKVTFASDSPALNQVQEKIDAVQVGTRNLFLKSKQRMPAGWGTGSVIKTSDGINFQNCTEWVVYGNITSEPLQVGEEYTISIKYRSENTPITDFAWYINQPNNYISFNTPDTVGKWGIVSNTRRIVDNGDIVLHLYVPHGTVTIDWIVITKGNKGVTDWTPAPEDLNEEITVAKQNATNAQNTANTAAQNAIDANKKLSDIANDNIVTPQEKPDTLKEWKQIEAERPKLVAQAGTYNINTDNYNNYYVALANYLTNSGVFLDMNVSTTVDGREFKNNFQNYYDVRQDLLKAISDAAKTYANGLVDNLQIGGRNLLQKSANIIMSGNDHQNSDNSVFGEITVLRLGKWNCYSWLTLPSGYDKVGKQLTMSLELYVDRQINFGVGVHFAYEQNLIRKDVSYITSGKWTKVFITYDKITGTNTSLIGLDGIDAPVGTKIKYRNFKLEEGNKATDWTPAPEDIQEQLTNAQNSANTANQKLSDIANDNLLTISEKPEVIKEWDIIAYEYEKIIAQAATYNTNSGNYTYFFNGLSSYLISINWNNLGFDSPIDGVEFRRKFREYYTERTDLLKRISDASKNYAKDLVDNIKIGGENLVDYSNNPLIEKPNYIASSGVSIESNNPITDGFLVHTFGEAGSGWMQFDIQSLWNGGLVKGKTYTISLETWSLQPIRIGIDGENLGDPLENPAIPASKEWKRIYRTFVYAQNSPPTPHYLIYFHGGQGTNYALRNLKLEEGAMATPWSRSQSDLDRQLKKAQDDANKANQKLSDIANDNILTTSEKPDVVKEWQEIDTEYPKLIQQSNSYNVDNSIYRTFYSALSAYLLAIQYDNFTIDTPINGQEFRQKFREYYDGRADLLSRITTATKNYTNQAAGELRNEARLKLLASQYTNGNCLYRDVDFRSSLNGLSVYNNSSNGTVELFLWTASAANAPTKSPNMAICRYNGGGAQPYLGGFYFGTPTRANAVFVVRLIMRLDVGYQITFHSNQAGDNYSFDWATPVDGTGKWEEYIGVLRCGATGTFSSSMFFAILGANKVIETYIAYASVFDVTDVDKYLEDRIKQNEQQTALAKAQADNALNTANRVSQLTSFLNTTIDGNLVASGTMLVGDVNGGNAGITGVTDQGSNSVRIFAGANYANKNKAPLNILDNGLIKMHHPNGNKGFELGIVNGKLVFNVYDDIGNLIMEMGSQGIIFSNYIPDSWTNLKLAKFDSANYSPYDATSVTNFANTNTRQIMVNNPGGIEDAQHWNINVPKTEASHINYSTYSAGRSYDSNTYVIYEGVYFEGTLQKPQKPNGSIAKLADGWYYNIVFLSVWKKYGDPYQTGAYAYTFQLFRLSAGKVVETKDYTINGQV